MRQLLLRVPDDVHTRLTARAARHGRSVNSVATEVLEDALTDEDGDARALVRARARQQDRLAPNPGPPPSEVDRTAILATTRGLGPRVDALFREGR